MSCVSSAESHLKCNALLLHLRKKLNLFYKNYQYMYMWLDHRKLITSRLTVVSREAKKKQHACASSGPRDHYSELFTRMAALNF